MKYGRTWILCVLIVAWCGHTHANPDLLEKLRTAGESVGPDVINDLYLMGDDALPFLIQTLTDENRYARRKAGFLLTDYYADPPALSVLTTLFLHNTDDQLRNSAAWAIASIDTEYAKKLMVRHLNSDVKTQEIVVDILSKLKDERVIPKLVERLEDPKASPGTRRSAAYALADFKDKRALPVLLDMLDKPESQGSTPIKSIAHIGDEQAIPKLLNLHDSAIGRDIANALPQFGVAIVPPLLEMLAQAEPRDIESMNVRNWIFYILRNIRTLESASFFESVCLETDDPELQSVMIEILQNMGTEGLRCLLNIAQQKPNPAVLRALGTYNRTVAVDAIAAHALDESSLFRMEAVQSLASFGGLWKAAVFKHIPHLLSDSNSKVKLLTIDLIRQLRLTEAIPALKQLTQDPDENIRSAARFVLDILSGQADLKLEVKTDQQQYDYGQPITLTYRLMNVSKYPIKIAIVPNIRLIERLDIQQPDGTSARYKGVHADFFGPRLEDYKTLHPGDELTDTISISQATHWIHQSGRYTVNLHIIPWGSGVRYDFLAWYYTITSKVDFNIAPPTTDQLDAILARIDAGDIIDPGKTYHQLCELNKSGLFPALKTRALIPLDSISNSEPTSTAQWLGAQFLTLSNTELVPKCIEMLPDEAMMEVLVALGDARAIKPLRQSAIGGSVDAALALQKFGDDKPIKWCGELARRKLRHWKKEERVKGAKILRVLQQPSNIKRSSWEHRNALTVSEFYYINDSPTLASDWAEIIEKAVTLEGLQELLDHAIPAVRRAAAYELAYLGNISGVHLIQQDLDANDTDTRQHARDTLLKLQRQ